MSYTLVELLSQQGIKPKRFTPGHTEQILCPKCEGGRKRETSLTVTVDADGFGAVWICHRGLCGWQDGARVRTEGGAMLQRPAPAERKIVAPKEDQHKDRPSWLYQFFAERGISDETVDLFGVYATRRRFPEPIGEHHAIVFPYRLKNELVNRKYRPGPPHKNPQLQDKDALQTLFNIDAVEADDEMIVVEGEPDVMAVHEAGYPQVVSLKDGAPAKVRDERESAEDKRYAALTTHSDLLGSIKRIILAGDMDTPGMALREELARRFGRHRCWQVKWPEGCKDACDTLRAHGKQGIIEAISFAEPYPIEGLQRIKIGTLLNLRHSPPPAVLTTGSRATDAVLKLPGEGRVIIVTGTPNSGKSTWLIFVSVHLMAFENRRFAVFSPEMQPWEHYVAQCSEVFSGKPFWPMQGIDSMTDADIVNAEKWFGDRLTMIVTDAERDSPTLDWILERAKVAVLQKGCTDLIVDPWNEVEQNRNGLTETEYVGRSLQRFRAFAFRHGCNVWIVAHPTKMFPPKPGEKLPPPGLYDVSGGANWANKADIGIAVHRTDLGTEIHVLKSRFKRWGSKGNSALLEFDPPTGRYSSPFTPSVVQAPQGASH